MTQDNQNLNPYATPTTPAAAAGSTDLSVEAIRRAHLTHETNVKSFGLLYYLGGVIMLLAGIGMIIGGIASGNSGGADGVGVAFFLGLGVLYLIMGSLQFSVGGGLRKLNSFGRIGGTVFGALGLLGIPVGTLISAFLLYLLWSEKGKMVFSDEYKDVLAATPHIKYKTSIVSWIVLGIVLLLFLGVIVLAMLGG